MEGKDYTDPGDSIPQTHTKATLCVTFRLCYSTTGRGMLDKTPRAKVLFKKWKTFILAQLSREEIIEGFSVYQIIWLGMPEWFVGYSVWPFERKISSMVSPMFSQLLLWYGQTGGRYILYSCILLTVRIARNSCICKDGHSGNMGMAQTRRKLHPHNILQKPTNVENHIYKPVSREIQKYKKL